MTREAFFKKSLFGVDYIDLNAVFYEVGRIEAFAIALSSLRSHDKLKRSSVWTQTYSEQHGDCCRVLIGLIGWLDWTV